MTIDTSGHRVTTPRGDQELCSQEWGASQSGLVETHFLGKIWGSTTHPPGQAHGCLKMTGQPLIGHCQSNIAEGNQIFYSRLCLEHVHFASRRSFSTTLFPSIIAVLTCASGGYGIRHWSHALIHFHCARSGLMRHTTSQPPRGNRRPLRRRSTVNHRPRTPSSQVTRNMVG